MLERIRGALTWPVLLFPGVHLIRMVTSKQGQWKHGETDDHEALAASTFTRTDEGVSVFLARTAEREVEVAAAQCLKRGGLAPALALRLTLSSIHAAHLRIEAVRGETGVVYIDRLHRDLRAQPSAYVELTKRLLKDRAAGADNVREIPAGAMVSVLEHFRKLGGDEIGSQARNGAQRICDDWMNRRGRRA